MKKVTYQGKEREVLEAIKLYDQIYILCSDENNIEDSILLKVVGEDEYQEIDNMEELKEVYNTFYKKIDSEEEE